MNRFTTKVLKALLIFGFLFHTQSLFAAGFYLQELGTPASIGTAGTARTTNNFGAESAFGNPAGMTGLTETQLVLGSQVLIPNIRFDSDIAEAGGSDGGNAGELAIIPSIFFVKPISDRARLGFSIVAPLGGGVDYGDDFVGRYSTTEAALQGAVKPRYAIGYHFFNDENTRYDVFEGVRQTYSGPLSLATDNMVWNITKNELIVRMTVSPDHAWSVAGPKPPPKPPAKGTVPDPVSDFIKAGRWNPAEEAQADMIKAFKKEHGMK